MAFKHQKTILSLVSAAFITGAVYTIVKGEHSADRTFQRGFSLVEPLVNDRNAIIKRHLSEDLRKFDLDTKLHAANVAIARRTHDMKVDADARAFRAKHGKHSTPPTPLPFDEKSVPGLPTPVKKDAPEYQPIDAKTYSAVFRLMMDALKSGAKSDAVLARGPKDENVKKVAEIIADVNPEGKPNDPTIFCMAEREFAKKFELVKGGPMTREFYDPTEVCNWTNRVEEVVTAHGFTQPRASGTPYKSAAWAVGIYIVLMGVLKFLLDHGQEVWAYLRRDKQSAQMRSARNDAKTQLVTGQNELNARRATMHSEDIREFEGVMTAVRTAMANKDAEGTRAATRELVQIIDELRKIGSTPAAPRPTGPAGAGPATGGPTAHPHLASIPTGPGSGGTTAHAPTGPIGDSLQDLCDSGHGTVVFAIYTLVKSHASLRQMSLDLDRLGIYPGQPGMEQILNQMEARGIIDESENPISRI